MGHISNSGHSDTVKLGDAKHSACIRRGSAGVVGSMMLLKSQQNMHAPFTQVGLFELLTTSLFVSFTSFTVQPSLVSGAQY